MVDWHDNCENGTAASGTTIVTDLGNDDSIAATEAKGQFTFLEAPLDEPHCDPAHNPINKRHCNPVPD